MLAGGRMRAKKEVLKRREELLGEVFEEAEKKLRAYVMSEKYRQDLVRIAIDACKRLGSKDVVIYANERDLKLLKKSTDEVSLRAGVNISFGKPIQTVGGIRVGALDKTVEMDSTFDGKMKREFEALRAKVAKLLFAGS